METAQAYQTQDLELSQGEEGEDEELQEFIENLDASIDSSLEKVLDQLRLNISRVSSLLAEDSSSQVAAGTLTHSNLSTKLILALMLELTSSVLQLASLKGQIKINEWVEKSLSRISNGEGAYGLLPQLLQQMKSMFTC